MPSQCHAQLSTSGSSSSSALQKWLRSWKDLHAARWQRPAGTSHGAVWVLHRAGSAAPEPCSHVLELRWMLQVAACLLGPCPRAHTLQSEMDSRVFVMHVSQHMSQHRDKARWPWATYQNCWFNKGCCCQQHAPLLPFLISFNFRCHQNFLVSKPVEWHTAIIYLSSKSIFG